jgi:hypothetical protein
MPVSSLEVQGRVTRPSLRQRSRLSNKAGLLSGEADGRTAIARRFRDLTNAIIQDSGGAHGLAEARLQLIRRFSAASCIAEAMEARLANGEEIDISAHATLCSVLVRLSTRIGINRTAREIVPTLSQYLKMKATDIEAAAE